MINSDYCCPKCGSNIFVEKQKASGPIWHQFRLDGEVANNEDMYDCLNITQASKYAYCAECDKRLFKLSEIEN